MAAPQPTPSSAPLGGAAAAGGSFAAELARREENIAALMSHTPIVALAGGYGAATGDELSIDNLVALVVPSAADAGDAEKGEKDDADAIIDGAYEAAKRIKRVERKYKKQMKRLKKKSKGTVLGETHIGLGGKTAFDLGDEDGRTSKEAEQKMQYASKDAELAIKAALRDGDPSKARAYLEEWAARILSSKPCFVASRQEVMSAPLVARVNPKATPKPSAPVAEHALHAAGGACSWDSALQMGIPNDPAYASEGAHRSAYLELALNPQSHVDWFLGVIAMNPIRRGAEVAYLLKIAERSRGGRAAPEDIIRGIPMLKRTFRAWCSARSNDTCTGGCGLIRGWWGNSYCGFDGKSDESFFSKIAEWLESKLGSLSIYQLLKKHFNIASLLDLLRYGAASATLWLPVVFAMYYGVFDSGTAALALICRYLAASLDMAGGEKGGVYTSVGARVLLYAVALCIGAWKIASGGWSVALVGTIIGAITTALVELGLMSESTQKRINTAVAAIGLAFGALIKLFAAGASVIGSLGAAAAAAGGIVPMVIMTILAVLIIGIVLYVVLKKAASWFNISGTTLIAGAGLSIAVLAWYEGDGGVIRGAASQTVSLFKDAFKASSAGMSVVPSSVELISGGTSPADVLAVPTISDALGIVFDRTVSFFSSGSSGMEMAASLAATAAGGTISALIASGFMTSHMAGVVSLSAAIEAAEDLEMLQSVHDIIVAMPSVAAEIKKSGSVVDMHSDAFRKTLRDEKRKLEDSMKGAPDV